MTISLAWVSGATALVPAWRRETNKDPRESAASTDLVRRSADLRIALCGFQFIVERITSPQRDMAKQYASSELQKHPGNPVVFDSRRRNLDRWIEKSVVGKQKADHKVSDGKSTPRPRKTGPVRLLDRDKGNAPRNAG